MGSTSPSLITLKRPLTVPHKEEHPASEVRSVWAEKNIADWGLDSYWDRNGLDLDEIEETADLLDTSCWIEDSQKL